MYKKIEIRGCETLEELKKVVELCDKAFDKTPYEYFERHILKDRTLQPEHTRILLLDDEVVSSVQIFPRKMISKDKIISFGGIGNVATLPDKRKKGFAQMLMLDAINYMKEIGYEFSLLTTTINKYYEKFGYKTLTRHIIEINDISPKNYDSVQAFDIDKHFNSIKEIYELYNQNSIGPTKRDDIYWLAQFDFCGEDKNLFLIYKSEDKILGYIRAVREDDLIKILEFGALSDYPKIFRILLESLSYKTNIRNFKIFASELEKRKLNLIEYNYQIDSDLMILFLNDTMSEDQKSELLKPNNITFWLIDLF